MKIFALFLKFKISKLGWLIILRERWVAIYLKMCKNMKILCSIINVIYLRFALRLNAQSCRFRATDSYSWLAFLWRRSSRGCWWCRRCVASPRPAPLCTGPTGASPFAPCHRCLGICDRARQVTFLCGCISNRGGRKSFCAHRMSTLITSPKPHRCWMIYLGVTDPYCMKRCSSPSCPASAETLEAFPNFHRLTLSLAGISILLHL